MNCETSAANSSHSLQWQCRVTAQCDSTPGNFPLKRISAWGEMLEQHSRGCTKYLANQKMTDESVVLSRHSWNDVQLGKRSLGFKRRAMRHIIRRSSLSGIGRQTSFVLAQSKRWTVDLLGIVEHDGKRLHQNAPRTRCSGRNQSLGNSK
jgi:hypothetical protein